MQRDFSDQSYSKVRNELLEWSYITCQREDGSYYGNGGSQCKLGAPSQLPERKNLNGAKSYGPKSEASYANLQKTLDGLPDKERKMWEDTMSQNIGGGGVNDPPKPMHYTGKNKGKPYTEEELDSQFSKRANGWDGMIKAGYPNGLKDRVGNVVEPPEGMIPRVTQEGQKTWVHPESGRIFTNASNLTKAEKEGNVWRQNRVSKEDSARRASDMVQFREDQKKGQGNGEWPTKKIRSVGEESKEVTNKDVDKLYNSLSKAEKGKLVGNGLDASGGPGMVMGKYYKDNPDLAEARAKDVCRRYLEQGGRSGVSGKPVALPGLEPKEGQERSSVDHFKPISGAANLKTGASIRKSRDNFGNFLITEEGFNSQRGNRDWNLYADKWAKDNRSSGVSPTPSAKASGGGMSKSSAPGVKTSSSGSKSRSSSNKPSTPKAKPSVPKSSAPKTTTKKTVTPEQRQAQKRQMQDFLNKAKKDKDSSRIKYWNDMLKKQE